MIPLRIHARRKDEAEPVWWVTYNMRAFVVLSDTLDVIDRAWITDLILLGHGRNDVEADATFMPQNKERYQPTRTP